MTLPQAPRLQFDLLTPDDAPFILELVNEPGWLQHIGDRNIHDLDAARHYIANGPAVGYVKNGYGLYRVSLKATGEVLGMSGLIKRDTLEHPDIGYAFLQRHAGQGYASEAGLAVRDFAAHTLGIKQLLGLTTLDNHASIRVLEKIGFRYQQLLPLPGLSDSKLFVWTA